MTAGQAVNEELTYFSALIRTVGSYLSTSVSMNFGALSFEGCAVFIQRMYRNQSHPSSELQLYTVTVYSTKLGASKCLKET